MTGEFRITGDSIRVMRVEQGERYHLASRFSGYALCGFRPTGNAFWQYEWAGAWLTDGDVCGACWDEEDRLSYLVAALA